MKTYEGVPMLGPGISLKWLMLLNKECVPALEAAAWEADPLPKI